MQSSNYPQGYPPGYQQGYPPQQPVYPQKAVYPQTPPQPQFYQAPVMPVQGMDTEAIKNIKYLNIAGVLLIIASLNAFFMASIELFDPSIISYFWMICGIMAGFGALFAFLKEERIIAILGAVFGILSIGLMAVGIILGIISLILIIKGRNGFNKRVSVLKI